MDTNRNWAVHWGFKEKDYDPAEEFPGERPFRCRHACCGSTSFWKQAIDHTKCPHRRSAGHFLLLNPLSKAGPGGRTAGSAE